MHLNVCEMSAILSWGQWKFRKSWKGRKVAQAQECWINLTGHELVT